MDRKRYYQSEHEVAYRAIEKRGLNQWNDLFVEQGAFTYEQFLNRPFLERVLATFEFSADSRVFEYGCGTGPAACFLADRGFSVDAIDLVPEAINIARRMAEELALHVQFDVADIVQFEPSASGYDMVLDSYCLQSIVTNEHREAVYSIVRDLLAADGLYVISTALRNPNRQDGPGYYLEESTGMYYREAPEDCDAGERIEIDGVYYIPHRRHHTRDALVRELEINGFEVLDFNGPELGDLVCRRR